MNLVVDIGNSQIKAAGFDKDGMIDSIRVKTANYSGMMHWMEKFNFTKAILCSVGKMSQKIPGLIEECCGTVIKLDQHTPLPFRVMYKTKETLGYDRIAAVSGAFKAYPGENTVIFDFGTAITIDFLSAEGSYLGGNISPGLKVRFRSLHDNTAGLPLLVKSDHFQFFGNDTHSSVTAGVQMGIIHEISGYINDYIERYASCKFIATGGDAEFFSGYIRHPVIINPSLVLEGLNFILEYNTR